MMSIVSHISCVSGTAKQQRFNAQSRAKVNVHTLTRSLTTRLRIASHAECMNARDQSDNLNSRPMGCGLRIRYFAICNEIGIL